MQASVTIEFLPLWLVQAWRVVLWMAELSLIASVVVFLPRAWRARHSPESAPEMPEWTVWVYLAVACFLVQSAWGALDHWNDHLTLSGLPATTACVVVCWVARVKRTS